MSKPLNIGLALSCMDYRLFDTTIDALKDICGVDAFDHAVLAGASLGYNQHVYPNWKDTFLEHVDLAIQLHNITQIVVVDHEDCGAYKLTYKHINKSCERAHHINNIKKMIGEMQEIYPELSYAGYILYVDGHFEHVK